MVLKRRLTKQRRLILDALRDSHRHLSADDIYGKLKEENPELSLGTVYRNLNVLCEQGEIGKIEGDFSSSMYDGNIKPHHHFHCLKCNAIYDVNPNYCRVLASDFEDNSGHRVDNHSMLFSGECKDCR